MAADQAADLTVAAHHVGETVDPGFVGVSVHPFDPAFDRRMVHDDIGGFRPVPGQFGVEPGRRSEEHTSELQSLMRISYAVFCLKKKKVYYYYSYTTTTTTDIL